VTKRLDRALCLAAVSATILLSACGGHTAVPSSGTSTGPSSVPSSGTSTAASAAQTPSSQGATTERVDAWFVDGGHAELTRLTVAIVGVGHASDTFAALGAACAKLAAAVASAQAGPPVPDAAAQASLTGALADYAKSAGDCQAGASAHNDALISKAATATSAATSYLQRFETETEDAQTKEVQSEEARRCKQLYQAWEDGPAHAAISQFLTALNALQVAESGTNLPAITTAAEKAAQPAAQLARDPVPACADPADDFAQILATVRTAAASVATAKSQSAVVQAQAPLKGVPVLEAAFTAEVKTATGT
jgi:hypothetical protein